MSVETSAWLNNYTLIGNTLKRGNAWHYRAADQGLEPNHYPGFVPCEDVKRRLFNWDAQEATIAATCMDANGVTTFADPTRKAVVRPVGALHADDMGGIMGIFKDGYQTHQFSDWLIDSVADLMGDDLGIESAGLLKSGAVAWVQISMPDTMQVAGFEFRPHLLACTSHDGTLATTYLRGCTAVVCDNTMSAALGEEGTLKVKIKHSRYSSLKLQNAADALQIVHATGDAFAAQVERLTNVQVSEGDWNAFLDTLAPVPEQEGRAATMAENKRAQLANLYYSDARVAPWHGTAWGVVQAVNTHAHHVANAHGGKVAERNALRAASGKVDALDIGTLDMLEGVLASA